MKYQVVSANSLVKMIISYKSDDSFMTIPVDVDYLNHRVYFEDKQDNVDLEQEILSFLRLPVMDRPEIPMNIFQHISDIESGNFGPDFKGYEAYNEYK